MTDIRLLLCLHVESQEHIQMAFDYWAGCVKDGKWVWAEPVTGIASRYNFKDSSLLQTVREAATAFDLTTRCSSAEHDIPRALSCRGELRMSCARDFVCEECKDRLRQERYREEEERAKALLWKKKQSLDAPPCRWPFWGTELCAAEFTNVFGVDRTTFVETEPPVWPYS